MLRGTDQRTPASLSFLFINMAAKDGPEKTRQAVDLDFRKVSQKNWSLSPATHQLEKCAILQNSRERVPCEGLGERGRLRNK